MNVGRTVHPYLVNVVQVTCFAVVSDCDCGGFGIFYLELY